MGKPKLGLWPWSHLQGPAPQGRRRGCQYALGHELEAPGSVGSIGGELGLTDSIDAHGGVPVQGAAARVGARGGGLRPAVARLAELPGAVAHPAARASELPAAPMPRPSRPKPTKT